MKMNLLLGIGLIKRSSYCQLKLKVVSFPIHIAANKADIAPKDLDLNFDINGRIVPCMADMELALRRAESLDLSITFLVIKVSKSNPEQLSSAQNEALEHMKRTECE